MVGKKRKPPRPAEWIINRGLDKSDRDVVLGDFQEFYAEKCLESGVLRALLWYWLQTLKSLPHFSRNVVYWQGVMLQNYLKITFRNIRTHRGYSFINIAGLSAGMASCIFILLWVQDELSYDRFHTNAQALYHIESDETYSGQKIHSPSTPVPLAPVLADEVPEVVRATRCTRFGGMHIRYKDNIFFENDIRAVDPPFFQMFSFPLLKGDEHSVLKEQFSIVLTEETAKKYFGEEEPVGKVLTVENQWEMTVTGVVKNAPQNSSIQFDGLIRFEFSRDQLERMPGGWVNAISTYAQLTPGSDPDEAERKITNLIHRHIDENKPEYQLNPMTRMHLYTRFGPRQGMGLIRYVYIFSLIAVAVLLIACINFMNLSTARSANRSKEIGLRKVVGALRGHVIRQFFTESLLLSFIALVFSLILVMLLLPLFNSLSWKQLLISDLIHGPILLGMIVMTILTGLIAGSYPALFLSSFQPIKILHGLGVKVKGRSILRKILVIIQFSISIFLIIGTSVIYKQVHFMKHTDIGFDKNHVMVIRMTGEIPHAYGTLKNELLQYPGIMGVTGCGRRPSMVNDTGQNINWEGKDPDHHANVVFHTVDYGYTELMNMRMVEGRSFSEKFASDSTGAFIINEALARQMGDNSPIGKDFQIFWFKGKIIGVVQNFHHTTLRREIQPLVMLLPPNPYWRGTLLVKIQPHDMPSTLKFIESVWKKIVPNFPFEAHFLDEDFEYMYRVDQRLGRLLNYFSVLAILIACLGLFGLVSFTVQQRMKEVGIRKVLGAATGKIVLMLSVEFVLWVVAANLIAGPAAWIVMGRWLDGFAYRTQLGFEVFLMAGIVVFIIALVTVSYQAFRAARANPVEALRYE